MPVSTIASALWKTGWINPESQKIIDQLNWNRSAEDMIWEYFWLRKEKVMSDDGLQVIDMVNEFKDYEVLQKKKVQFVSYFAYKGMTQEMYDRVIPTGFKYNPNKDEQSNSNSTPDIEIESTIPAVSKGTWKAKK